MRDNKIDEIGGYPSPFAPKKIKDYFLSQINSTVYDKKPFIRQFRIRSKGTCYLWEFQ